MKTYNEFMREISSDELYRGLLAFGMFTDKLPPVFTSEPFYDFCETLSQPFTKEERRIVNYEAMRHTSAPRIFAIPNPFAYQLLCRCLADNWDKLCDHFENQTGSSEYKISRIHVRKMPDSEAVFTSLDISSDDPLGLEGHDEETPEPTFKEHIFDMNFPNWRDGSPELDIIIGKYWLVKADISNCFPSIYTHAIPWALVGKDVAKTSRNGNTYFNKLDKMCQNMNYGETHGIPIGPHASNLISEIILTCVDERLHTRWKYIRNIDDYTCFVESREDADAFLADLIKCLRDFGLSINHKKTSIIELPKTLEEDWRSKVDGISQYERNGKLNFKSVQYYLNNAINLAQKSDMNLAVLKYAVKVLGNRRNLDRMTDNAKHFCCKVILHLASIHTYLVPLLDEYVFGAYNTEPAQLKGFAEKVLRKSVKTRNFQATSFCVYFALKYEVELPDLNADLAIESGDCVFMIMTKLYFDKNPNAIESDKILAHAETLLADKDDFEKNWLFVYEALPASKFSGLGDWTRMKNSSITFINTLDDISELI